VHTRRWAGVNRVGGDTHTHTYTYKNQNRRVRRIAACLVMKTADFVSGVHTLSLSPLVVLCSCVCVCVFVCVCVTWFWSCAVCATCLCCYTHRANPVPRTSGRCHAMNEAHLSHLPFWGPSEAVLFLIKRPSG